MPSSTPLPAPRGHRIGEGTRPVGLEELDPAGAEPVPAAAGSEALDPVVGVMPGTEQGDPATDSLVAVGHGHLHPVERVEPSR